MISRSDRTRERADAGFTLIEMLVVVAIVAMMTVLIVGGGRQVSPAVHARAAAQAISGALRSARGEALSGNRAVFFTLDLVNRRYQVSGMPAVSVAGDLQLALLTSADQLASGAEGRIRFDPDGGSTGGRVTVAGGGKIWWVGVDWLSGRVSVEEKPQQ